MPDDPLGVVTLQEGQAIRIGFWGSLSGPFAAPGEDALRGVELALDERGRSLIGRPIDLVTEDTWCTPRGGREAAQRLTSEAGLVGLVGPVCTAEAAGVEIITAAGLTTITPGDSSEWGVATRPGYLRTVTAETRQAELMADFAYVVLGLDETGILVDRTEGSAEMADAFARHFEGLGGSVVGREQIPIGERALRDALLKLHSAGADGLFLSLLPGDAARTTAQAREMRRLRGTALMTSEMAISERFFEMAGQAARGMFVSAHDLRSWPAKHDALATEYFDSFGEWPAWLLHAYSYDATNLLIDALTAIAVEDGEWLHVPLGALRQRLMATDKHAGVTGMLSCDEIGNCAALQLAIFALDGADAAGGYIQSQPLWLEDGLSNR